MSEENKITISPQVQLVETAAQKSFLEQRVLMLSQLLHDKAEEVLYQRAQSATHLGFPNR
ncbi:hypothetical protein WGT02_38585 (plasmid) [Rhizobium sp. T1470]|uniref:hypothetical protein n=1 Tax=unclassified Rhizobium TaxID=2613769 RepID=UPI001AAF9C4E|nr:hypothetical protein [Rhizobium sp. T1473]MCA0807315.1 hypothetical protein [Rhizobium sp. T1473]